MRQPTADEPGDKRLTEARRCAITSLTAAQARAGPASPVRSSLAAGVVHRPAVAWGYRSRPGTGSASAARQAGAWKGSAKYWVSW